MAWAPDYITLDQLKSFVKIPVSDMVDDAELGFALTSGARAIDTHTNRQFGKTDSAEQRLYTARPDFKRGKWIVDVDDFQTTSGLIVTINGVATTEFVKEPVNAAQEGKAWTRLSIAPTAAVKPTGDEYEVAITIVWGWTTVPIVVKQANELQSSRFFNRRTSPYGIAGSPDQGSELRLLSKVDPDVALMLKGYSRPRRTG